MPTIGIELSDAGLLAASCHGGESAPLQVPDRAGCPEWPGFCYAEGGNLTFGRSAEDLWFVQPRRVVHNFWARLAHEPSTVTVNGRPTSFSELTYLFLRDFTARLHATAGSYDKVVLALPGSYLKDQDTEEEKVGLLLGIAGELQLPLAGLVDLAGASLCDPSGPGINQSLPVVVLDLNLEGAEMTLLARDDKLRRRDFFSLPQCGIAALLKQLTATLGNRFLRHTAFDILEDGRIEQTFFRQTKEFLFTEASEFRFLINTATRAYEMTAKRDQLILDAQTFVTPIVNGLQAFLRDSPHASEPCTIALTDRAAHLPGLEQRLRAAGFARLVRLPRGAAACGAARIGDRRLQVPADLADVPLETAVCSEETRSLVAAPWEARLHKLRQAQRRLPPTHAILGGIGQPLSASRRFTIGLADQNPDLVLPHEFGATEDLVLHLTPEDGRLWFVEPVTPSDQGSVPPMATRIEVEAGDRLEIRCGQQQADILFAHCPAVAGGRLS